MSSTPFPLLGEALDPGSPIRPGMDSATLTVKEVLLLPSILCGVTVVFAAAVTQIAGVDYWPLVTPYFATSAAVTLLCVLLSLFWSVLELARARADKPLSHLRSRLKSRLPLMLLPVVVFPLFLVHYTAAKTAIPFVVGYSWDGFWGEADRLIFGDDAWRIAHAWLGNIPAASLEWVYTAVWGGALIFTSALVPLHADRRRTALFYSAMLGTWLIGGVFCAYLFSAAGPVFAQLSAPELASRFAPLHEALQSSLDPKGAIGATQTYLVSAVDRHLAVKGGGISAMPSMHLGATSVYVLAARGTKWLIPALLLWLTIFVLSGYFGYHYWVDGIAAAAVAGICWALAEAFYGYVAGKQPRLS